LRLQRSPPGDARTQEVSFVQIGEPTGCRLRAEPARRGEKSRRQAANMRRYTNRCNVRSPIFDEIRHESEVSRRSHRESVILRGPLVLVWLGSAIAPQIEQTSRLPYSARGSDFTEPGIRSKFSEISKPHLSG